MSFAATDNLHEGVRAVAATVRDGRRPALPGSIAADRELNQLLDDLVELHRFAFAVSQGDLDTSLALRGSLAGALKALHASLRHVTWHTQRVADGDFSQRIDFLGDFSKAFNSMTASLERLHRELDERNEALGVQARKLEELATTDALTNVFNRRKFDEIVDGEVVRAGRYRRHLSLLILDVDGLKHINDVHGHGAGDSVLVDVAACARATLRSVDSFARWGGDEFVALLPEVELPGAVRAAQRVCEAIRTSPVAGGVTASVGVAQLREGETTDELLQRADLALYRAKARGRDRVGIDE